MPILHRGGSPSFAAVPDSNATHMLTTLPILLLITLLLPLVVYVLLQGIGPRLGEPLAGYVGAGGAVLTFGMAVVTMIAWLYGGSSWGFHAGPYVQTIGWLPIGSFASQRNDGFLDLAFYVDSLAIALITTVTFISVIVHLFSFAYMRGDPRYPQFFAYLSLIIFSMIGLALSASLVQLLVAWELVGICSFLLIGFWYENAAARLAAIKVFVTHRIGDVGFVVGIGIIVAHMGNSTLPDLWLTLGDPQQQIMSKAVLSVVGVLLACAAMWRSAQVPLHTWLPNATAGPTAGSALIHAATMTAAGVFMLVRIYPILTPGARLFVVAIGAITIAVGSLCALAQRDLRHALSFATIAQLGFAVLAIGVGSWIGATFFLLTSAFSIALLLLAAGTVVRAMSYETRLEKYGGLYRRLPVAAVTFAIGALALSGMPFFSGFYSQQMVLAHVAAWTSAASESGRSAMLQLAFWVPVLGVYLTPLYLTRLWMLTFAGRTRDRKHSRQASEAGIMSFSLVALSGMAIVAGYAWFPIQPMVEEAAVETRAYTAMARIDPLAATWPTLASPTEIMFDATEGVEVRQTYRTPVEIRVAEGADRAQRLTWLAWLLGIAVGVLIYARGFAVTDRLGQGLLFRGIRAWLREGMSFDRLYHLVFASAARVMKFASTRTDHASISPAALTESSYRAQAGLACAIVVAVLGAGAAVLVRIVNL